MPKNANKTSEYLCKQHSNVSKEDELDFLSRTVQFHSIMAIETATTALGYSTGWQDLLAEDSTQFTDSEINLKLT